VSCNATYASNSTCWYTQLCSVVCLSVTFTHHACQITSLVHNWHASTCVGCCSSSRLWHTHVRSRPIPSTAWWAALAQRSWASAGQAGSDGSPVPSRWSAEVPGRPLHPSLRCRQSTASEICQSTLPYCSAVSTKHVRPSGLRCWGSDGLELITG